MGRRRARPSHSQSITMMQSSSATARHRALMLFWAGTAIVMACVVVWGAMQTEDPLSRYIHTDKVRHILAFGAIGLCAGLMPSARSRLVGLGAVITFAMLVEIIQIPIAGRTASVSDLFASGVGGFGGFGLGAAILMAWDIVRKPISPAQTHAQPRT